MNDVTMMRGFLMRLLDTSSLWRVVFQEVTLTVSSLQWSLQCNVDYFASHAHRDCLYITAIIIEATCIQRWIRPLHSEFKERSLFYNLSFGNCSKYSSRGCNCLSSEYGSQEFSSSENPAHFTRNQ